MVIGTDTANFLTAVKPDIGRFCRSLGTFCQIKERMTNTMTQRTINGIALPTGHGHVTFACALPWYMPFSL